MVNDPPFAYGVAFHSMLRLFWQHVSWDTHAAPTFRLPFTWHPTATLPAHGMRPYPVAGWAAARQTHALRFCLPFTQFTVFGVLTILFPVCRICLGLPPTTHAGILPDPYSYMYGSHT